MTLLLPRRPAFALTLFLAAALALSSAPTRADDLDEDGVPDKPAAKPPMPPGGYFVVLKTGQRLMAIEPPVIAFGRVLYKGHDGIQHALALSVVDVEKTRASMPPAPAAPRRVAAPKPAPAQPASSAPLRMATDFQVVTSDGRLIKLSDLRGKVVLVDFWATWCGPCVVEMPNVKKLHAKLAGPDFEIVGVSLDSERERWDAYVKSHKLTWPHQFDGLGWGNTVAQAYGVRSIPMTVLIDRQGRIVRQGLRGHGLEPAVASLIASSKPTVAGGRGTPGK